MYRGPLECMTARLRMTVVLMLCLIGTIAFPMFAHAETWTSAYPMGTIHTQPAKVGVDVFGAAALNIRTAVITIDGVPQTTFVTRGPASGHWAFTEGLVGGIWKITWIWSADTGTGIKSTLYCYPKAGDGARAVTVAVKDVNGVSLSYSWSYTVASAPVFGAPVPGAGLMVTSPTPAIYVPVSDNSGVTSVVATVNGTSATATLGGGKVTVTGFTLSSDGPVTVVVSATDAAGYTSTRTWAFSRVGRLRHRPQHGSGLRELPSERFSCGRAQCVAGPADSHRLGCVLRLACLLGVPRTAESRQPAQQYLCDVPSNPEEHRRGHMDQGMRPGRMPHCGLRRAHAREYR